MNLWKNNTACDMVGRANISLKNPKQPNIYCDYLK